MDPIAVKICDDLREIRNFLSHRHDGDTHEIVAAYLISNASLIEFLLKQAYETHTLEEREELLKTHRELNAISALPVTFEHARNILRSAQRYWIDYEWSLEDDDIHQILRGLEYAKYLCKSGNRVHLLLHPIQRYLAC